MKRNLIVITVVLILGISSALIITSGQDDSPDEIYCEGAQDWYDEIMIIGDAVQAGFDKVNANFGNPLEFAAGYEDMKSASEELETLEYPECVLWAYERFVAADNAILASVEAASRNDEAGYWQNLIGLARLTGEARGYLYAIGVEITETRFSLDDE